MKLKNVKFGDVVEAAAGFLILVFVLYSLVAEGRSLGELEMALLVAALGGLGLDGNLRNLFGSSDSSTDRRL